MYPSTTRRPDDTAGIITLRLGWSPTTGDGASLLIMEGFGGRVITVVTIAGQSGSEGLQVAEATGDVHVLQAEASVSKLRS